MLTPRKAWRRLRAILFRDRLDRELDEELHFHLETEVSRLAARGVPPDEARRQARIGFGPFSSSARRPAIPAGSPRSTISSAI